MPSDARVLSVNVGRERPSPVKDAPTTGIDKRPVDGPVLVRAPGAKHDGLGSGLVGDPVCDRSSHGGDDQAVYAYAREDLDRWEAELGRRFTNGAFGENLTTHGIDITHARIGERWRIGDELELQVTDPRIPCSTFRWWIAERGWLKTFTAAACPGAYLRVVTPGEVAADDPIVVTHVPAHDVTVQLVFRATTRERELLPSVLTAGDDLPEETRLMAERGETFSLD
jgi:MOSC domain-containing protein YiiM